MSLYSFDICFSDMSCSRRDLLKVFCFAGTSLIFLPGCDKHFKRPGGQYDLGEVRYLLYRQSHLPRKSLLVYRYDDGWSALSTRCAYDGCDLTFQNKTLFCSCCKSIYSQLGEVLQGPTTHPLPWYKMFYKNNHLYVNSSVEVSKDERFTTPEIEAELKKTGELIEREGAPKGVEIPRVLLGDSGASAK